MELPARMLLFHSTSLRCSPLGLPLHEALGRIQQWPSKLIMHEGGGCPPAGARCSPAWSSLLACFSFTRPRSAARRLACRCMKHLAASKQLAAEVDYA
ncbi:hypothetical protein Dimus_016512 [Dionaea muscipula]